MGPKDQVQFFQKYHRIRPLLTDNKFRDIKTVSRETRFTSTTLPSAVQHLKNEDNSEIQSRQYHLSKKHTNRQTSEDSSIHGSMLGGQTECFSIDDEQNTTGIQSTRSHQKLPDAHTQITEANLQMIAKTQKRVRTHQGYRARNVDPSKTVVTTQQPWTPDNNFFSVNVNMNLNLNLCVRHNSRDLQSQSKKRALKSREKPRDLMSIQNKLSRREQYSQPPPSFQMSPSQMTSKQHVNESQLSSKEELFIHSELLNRLNLTSFSSRPPNKKTRANQYGIKPPSSYSAYRSSIISNHAMKDSKHSHRSPINRKPQLIEWILIDNCVSPI